MARIEENVGHEELPAIPEDVTTQLVVDLVCTPGDLNCLRDVARSVDALHPSPPEVYGLEEAASTIFNHGTREHINLALALLKGWSFAGQGRFGDVGRRENTMRVYTAETSSGDIYLVHGEYGNSPTAYSTKREREAFAEMALAFLRTHPQDERTAQELTLYEWDEKAAGAWLTGDPSVAPKSWTAMASEAEFGQITYEYPGDWVIRIGEEAQ